MHLPCVQVGVRVKEGDLANAPGSDRQGLANTCAESLGNVYHIPRFSIFTNYGRVTLPVGIGTFSLKGCRNTGSPQASQ